MIDFLSKYFYNNLIAMIVDIIFVVLVIVLILAIYKLKFKNDTTKIANTTINDIAR